MKQDVGERGAGLAFTRRERGNAVREMNRKVGLARQHKDMVVPRCGGGRRNADLAGLDFSGRESLARPPQGLDDFALRISAEFRRTCLRRAVGPGRNLLLRKPGLVAFGYADPGCRSDGRDLGEQRAPDWIDIDDAVECNASENSGREMNTGAG